MVLLAPGAAPEVAGNEPSVAPQSTSAAPAPSDTLPAPTDAPSPNGSSSPSDGPPATPPDGGPAPAQVALVPVVGFWSGEESISRRELARALVGESARYERVIVPEADRDAIAAALGVSLGAGVESGGPAQIRRAAGDGALGLLRVADVTPAVRALAIDDVALFGNRRLADLGDWPLLIPGAGAEGAAWDQRATWTLVAGGDVQLDRWMAYHVTTLEKGVDWPWDGGRVRITRRVCCSDLGHRVPLWERTADDGAVRGLFSEADLAIANLEAAAVDNPRYHTLGERFRFSLSFSGDPRLLDGLSNAGFDFLSLANNHIHNAGPAGIRDTRRHLERLGIAFAGAGRDIEQATEGAVVEAGGRRVAILPCTSVGLIARADRHGAAPCSGAAFVRQVASAAESADVVVVFPHWGREYRAAPSAGQRNLARRWVAAGADLVLGAHSHWAGAIEEIGDGLASYSMGNLAFDQPWSEPTMQGLILELTFHGHNLAQARLHPTLIVDHVQPNLLDYDGGGRRVLERVREASEGLLPY